MKDDLVINIFKIIVQLFLYKDSYCTCKDCEPNEVGLILKNFRPITDFLPSFLKLYPLEVTCTLFSLCTVIVLSFEII